MKTYQYLVPDSVSEVLQMLERLGGSGLVLAGGTDAVVRLKRGELSPEAVIDIGGLGELAGIVRDGQWLHLGPVATHREVARNPLVRQLCPALSSACSLVGSPQIRNVGTIGGNVVNGSPAGDTIPPLVALNAILELSSKGSVRTVPIGDFYTGPGETVLRPDELVTKISVPVVPGQLSCYLRLGQRSAMCIAKVSVAAALVMEKGKILHAGIALGAVGPKVIRAQRSESLLEGEAPTHGLLEEVANLASKECDPIDDLRSNSVYRRAMVRHLVYSGLKTLVHAEGH